MNRQHTCTGIQDHTELLPQGLQKQGLPVHCVCILTRKSLSKPSICAAIAAEFGLEPRRSLDKRLLGVPVPMLDA